MNKGVRGRRKSVDWEELRAQIRQAERSHEEALNPSLERAKIIMEERARALAQATVVSPDTQVDLVLFRLGQERYGIEARFVREVGRFVEFTPLPWVPQYVLGVANLRGTILPLMNLARLLGVSEADGSNRSRLIVLGLDRAEFGVLADEIQGQAYYAPESIFPPSGELLSAGGAIQGVTSDSVGILDGQLLLGDPRLTLAKEENAGD